MDVFVHADFPDGVAALEIVLSHQTVSVVVVAEDDSLACTPGQLSSELQAELRPASPRFWMSLLGYVLTDAWTMVSEAGAVDALHLRFREQCNTGMTRDIQIVAVASALRTVEFAVLREEWAVND